MNSQIFMLHVQDDLTNGTTYLLLALAIVLVFGVTRILFIPQGDFVSLAALTMASLQTHKMPATVWLLLCVGAGLRADFELVCGRCGRLAAQGKAGGAPCGEPHQRRATPPCAASLS
jgi:branched-subunit amino acid ABC-type transport system permease component